MQMRKPISKLGRRGFLKAAGATGAALGSVGISSAKANHEKFHGFTYNPQTHEILGEVSMDVTRNDNSIQGIIQLPKLAIPFDSSAVSRVNDSEYVLERHLFKTNGKDKRWEKKHDARRFSVEITSAKRAGLGGLITDRKRSSRIAFSLANTSAKTKATGGRSAVRQELDQLRKINQGDN
ncbi:twin-arginine translocation signal domain-containing protein [Haloferax volcanii]|uniref:twin-arginine translocation signal domain-containing protein n=1 Tax=Haloferax volcanii TaxID=2246 RepID=UPI00385AF578